jgi:hypothetical protein
MVAVNNRHDKLTLSAIAYQIVPAVRAQLLSVAFAVRSQSNSRPQILISYCQLVVNELRTHCVRNSFTWWSRKTILIHRSLKDLMSQTETLSILLQIFSLLLLKHLVLDL